MNPMAGGVEVPLNDRPISQGNIVLSDFENIFNENSLIDKSNRVIAASIECRDGWMYVSKADYKRLKKIPFFNKVKKYIKKK